MGRIFVTDTLCFGDGGLCQPHSNQNQVIIHACKEPCHRYAVGYEERSLQTDHTAYLAYECGSHLYLNLIDPPVPLFKKQSFDIFLSFVDRMHKEARPIFIHCNQGQSRAPSLTLLYMAKRLDLLPNNSYGDARRAFEAQFPYRPGAGIARFLEENWEDIG